MQTEEQINEALESKLAADREIIAERRIVGFSLNSGLVLGSPVKLRVRPRSKEGDSASYVDEIRSFNEWGAFFLENPIVESHVDCIHHIHLFTDQKEFSFLPGDPISKFFSLYYFEKYKDLFSFDWYYVGDFYIVDDASSSFQEFFLALGDEIMKEQVTISEHQNFWRYVNSRLEEPLFTNNDYKIALGRARLVYAKYFNETKRGILQKFTEFTEPYLPFPEDRMARTLEDFSKKMDGLRSQIKIISLLLLVLMVIVFVKI